MLRGPAVALGGLGEWLERGADNRPALGIEQAVDPDHAVDGLANPQVAARVGAIRLVERSLRVDLVLEVLGDADELPRVHRFGGLEQRRLGFADLGGAHGLRGAGHGERMLVADLAAGQGFFRPGQLFQLVGDVHALGGRGARQFSIDA